MEISIPSVKELCGSFNPVIMKTGLDIYGIKGCEWSQVL